MLKSKGISDNFTISRNLKIFQTKISTIPIKISVFSLLQTTHFFSVDHEFSRKDFPHRRRPALDLRIFQYRLKNCVIC